MVSLNLLPFLSHIKTNEIIIFLVFIIFISAVILLLKKMDAMNESSTVRLEREQMSAQSMVRLINPFMFKIKEESLNLNNYRNGVKVSIRCDNSFWVFSFWAVNIEELHYHLDNEWQPMRHSLLDNKFIENQYLFKSEPELYYETNEDITHWIKPPNEFFTGESLGYNPRTRYPLVVIIVRNDDDDGIVLNDNDVVCLITIIHLKDTICTMNTSLITQYLKQRSGNMFNLHQIFTPESDNESANSPMCVICQTNLISHTILPCRHACLCQKCFARVDKCPLCRSAITSFFRVGDDEDITADNDSDPQEVNTSNGWFSRLNYKINRWLRIN